MTGQPTHLDPENLWDQILSRQVALIQEGFASLTQEEQRAVIAHLTRMAEEPGWHAEQSHSARVALQALAKEKPSN
jgi:hypothetical protein